MLKPELLLNMPISDLKVFKLDKVKSYDVDLSSQVVRALSIVDTLLSKADRKEECIHTFKPLATQFIPLIKDEELYEIINDYILSPGVVCVIDSIYVGKLSTGAIMQMSLVDANDDKVPYIYFDAFLASNDRGVRQFYLHLVKILCVCCRMITPGLIRLSQIRNSTATNTTPSADVPKFPLRFATPEYIGPICSGKGDSGSGFEDAALGGRVLLDTDNLKAPFAHNLRLKTLPYPQFPPTMAGNDSLRIIPDEYVTDIVAQWTAWLEHGGKIPSLVIPVDSLAVLQYARFQNLEAAALHFNKKRMKAADPSPAERARKLPKKSHAEGEELEVASRTSEEKTSIFNRYRMGANEDDDELEQEQEGSVLTGGIGAQQLEEMKKDPFLRF